jgi:hypothetical protein
MDRNIIGLIWTLILIGQIQKKYQPAGLYLAGIVVKGGFYFVFIDQYVSGDLLAEESDLTPTYNLASGNAGAANHDIFGRAAEIDDPHGLFFGSMLLVVVSPSRSRRTGGNQADPAACQTAQKLFTLHSSS